ncbi:MAG: hypothetical protein AB8B64_07125 [Granulosicoccus sp.]
MFNLLQLTGLALVFALLALVAWLPSVANQESAQQIYLGRWSLVVGRKCFYASSSVRRFIVAAEALIYRYA